MIKLIIVILSGNDYFANRTDAWSCVLIKNKYMKQPVILLGMHRSGTSLFTSLLQKLGVFIGNDIDGNYESEFFCKLNDWAMFQAGATWDCPYNMNFLTDKFISSIKDVFIKHLNSNHVKKYNIRYSKLLKNNEIWAWKDPRNTFTYPIWQKIFPNAKYIHIYRNPIDVAESLYQRELKFQQLNGSKTRTGIKQNFNEKLLITKRLYSQSLRINDIYEGIKLWQVYVNQALNISENIIHLQFENLLENPISEINSVCSFIGLDIEKQKLINLIKNIDVSKKYAFLEKPNLVEIYKDIRDDSLVKRLNYNEIL